MAAARALGALATALLLAGLAHALVAPHASGTLEQTRHVTVFVLAARLILLRAATLRSGRGIWLLIGIGASVDFGAQCLWTFVYDTTTSSPADALFAVAYVLTLVGLSRLLRRRVGDALRTFSYDGLGITLYVAAIGSAFLLVPIMRHTNASQLGAAVCLLYPAADLALLSVIVAVSSFTGRRQGSQDRLLGAAFGALGVGDTLFVLGQAGWIADASTQPWSLLTWEAAGLLVAAAAWARPSPAGSLRIGGWWESVPTLLWTAVGGGVLIAAWAFDLPAMVVVLGAATLVSAAARGRRVVREVRELVVVRAESLEMH